MSTHINAYPVDPYPGTRPQHSYVQVEDCVLRLNGAGAPGTWSVAGCALDGWLHDRGTVAMADRTPLLSYGSNACPSKLVDLRSRCNLPGPVVLSRCTVNGLAAAWCNGERDLGSIPATLTISTGREEHFLWWVAPDQWEALDRCEGRRGRWYDLVELSSEGWVLDEDEEPVEQVFAYVGGRAQRHPLVDEAGRSLLVRDHSQNEAAEALERLRCVPQPTPAPLGRLVVGHPVSAQHRSVVV